jgi:hypothetical protein
MTALPWVAVTPPEDAVRDVGDSVPLRFTTDREGPWRVRVGGTWEAPGTVAAEGHAVAGTPVTLDLPITEDFEEGPNLVWIVVDGAVGAGRTAVKVAVDRAPPAVALPAGAVGFGDGRVVVRVEAPEAADLDHLTLYVSSVPFAASDWPTGGPTPEAPGGLAPVVRAASPGEAVTFEVDGLANDVPVYVAVRATDAGGREGPMSPVRTSTPAATFGAAARAGDPGSACGHVDMPAAGGALGALAACARVLRRRPSRILGRGVPPPATPPGSGA